MFFFLLAERRNVSSRISNFPSQHTYTHAHIHFSLANPFSHVHTPLPTLQQFDENKKKKDQSKSHRENFRALSQADYTLSRIFLFLTTNLSNPFNHTVPRPPSQFTLHRRSNKYNIISRAVHTRRFFTPHSPLLFLRCFIIVT